MNYVENMVIGYAECLLWQATDFDKMERLDNEYGTEDFSDELWEEIKADCQDFYDHNREDLEGMKPEQAGHEFILTRNGHGAGFWDLGLGERGDRLAKGARVYGSHDVEPVNKAIRSV